MSAPRLDNSTKDQIVNAYLAGDKISEIAKRFGVDQSYPNLIARRRGHVAPKRNRRIVGWQSISTAPKDGTEVIGRCGPNFQSFSCFWDGDNFLHYDHDEGLVAYPVAQWMPLPPVSEG